MLALPAPAAAPGLDWSWAFYPSPPPEPARVPILMLRYDVTDGLGRWTEKARAVLAANNRPPRLFQRGDTLCRLQDSLLTGRSRLVTLDDIYLNYHISQYTTWVRVMLNSRGEETIDAGDTPLSVARNILAAPAWDELDFPPVRELAECPRFAADGRLLTAPGYHRREELFLCPPRELELPPIPTRPTQREVEAARETLAEDLLGDFNLDAPSLAHALCALWEPLVRRLIGGPCPLYLCDAPTMSSGKSLLASVLQIPVTGRAGEPCPPKEDDAEMRKAITALLLDAPTYVLLDNVTQLRNFPSLAALITSPSGIWKDRILGASRMVSLPIYSTWLLTSNNCVMTRELLRRTALIRLNPGVEEPWKRSESDFRHPELVDWTLAQRAALLHAALVLVQNWVALGMPPGAARMGSFERWAGVMSGICSAAGIAGFLQNRDALFDRDPDALRWRLLVREWFRRHGARLVSVADLFTLISGDTELDTAFADTLGQGQERKQRQRLAQALVGQADRVWAGYAVEPQYHASHGGFPLYRLLPTRAAEAEIGAEAEAEIKAEADPPDEREPDAWDDPEPGFESPNPWDDPDR